MVEYYKPTPIEDRESQKVGMSQLVPWVGKLMAWGAAGAAIAWTGAKLLKPSITKPNAVKGMIFKDTEHFSDGEIAAIGAKVGVVGKAFMMWRKAEAERKGVEDMLEGVQDLAQHHLTNEDLSKDNELVKDMIAYEERKQEEIKDEDAPTLDIHAKSSEHKGTAATVPEHEIT